MGTVFGNMTVDSNLQSQLMNTGNFTVMNRSIDEKEHSGEMHYPFMAKVISSVKPLNLIKILPIMVGSLSNKTEEKYGKILQPFLNHPTVFTIVSSDFCHWGSRFCYTPHDSTHNEIHDYIHWLDHLGMKHIEMKKPGAFVDYLKLYQNTICGRHPITVWLHTLEPGVSVKFVHYNQSSKVRKKNDSSVSYASAVAFA